MKKYILFAAAVMMASACEKVPSASVFDGEFPAAELTFTDPDFPARARLTASPGYISL